MKCIFLLILFAFTFSSCTKMNMNRKKLIVPKIPTKCKNIKCPAIEKQICVKLKYNRGKLVNKTTYILMVNQCELEYMKCHQDIDGFVVPMKHCNHKLNPKYDKPSKSHRRSKRSARFDANIDDKKIQEKEAVKSKKVNNLRKEVLTKNSNKTKTNVALKNEKIAKDKIVKKTSKKFSKNVAIKSQKQYRRHRSDSDTDMKSEKPLIGIDANDGGYRAKLKFKEKPLSDIDTGDYAYGKKLRLKGESSEEPKNLDEVTAQESPTDKEVDEPISDKDKKEDKSDANKEASEDDLDERGVIGEGKNSDKDVVEEPKLLDKSETGDERTDDGEIGEEKILDKGLVEEDGVIDKGAIGDERLIDKGIIGDERVIDKGVIGDESVIDKGVIGDERVIDKGVIGDERVIDKGVIGDERIIDKGVIGDVRVIDKGVIAEDRMFSEPMFGSGLEIVGSDGAGDENDKLNQYGSAQNSDNAGQSQNDGEVSGNERNQNDDDSQNKDSDDGNDDVPQTDDNREDDQIPNKSGDDGNAQEKSQEIEEECPSSCPQRNVMVCGRCREGVYRTFLSVCHLRMFVCSHPEEEMELISRVPCAMSAPYIAPDLNMEPVGKVQDPTDDDRVLRFIRCREKGLLETSWEKLSGVRASDEILKLKGDKKCYFDKEQKLKLKKYDYSSYED